MTTYDGDALYCAFCDNEAIAVIERSDTPICGCCYEIYRCGQGNPEGAIDYLDELDDDRIKQIRESC
jgi:hypothetical protein